MGERKIIIAQSAAESISSIAYFIVAKGMLATSEKFVLDIYDFIYKLGDERKSYPYCMEPQRKKERLKCVTYKKKFTIVFTESISEIFIFEIIPSKMIYW